MKKSLISASVTLMLVRAAGVCLQLVTTIFLARNLTLVEMGYFALMYASLGFVRAIGSGGVDLASMRQIAQSLNGDEITDSAQKLSVAGIVIAAVLGAGVSLLAILANALGHFENDSVLLFAFAAPAYVMMGLLVGQIRGLGYNASAQIPEAIGLQLFMILFVAFFLFQGNLTLLDTLLALVAAGWLSLVLQLGIRIAIGFDLTVWPNRRDYKLLIVDGWSIFQAQIFTVLAMRAPIFLTSAILGASATAIMEIALRFGNLPSLLTSSVGATFSPTYARLSFAEDFAELKQKRLLAGALAGVPSIVYLILCAGAGGAVLSGLFPESYQAAYVPILLVVFGSVLNAIFGPASNVFLMSGQAGIVRIYSIFRLLAVVIISIFAGPYWGSIGIAAGICVGFAIRDIGLSAVATKRGF